MVEANDLKTIVYTCPVDHMGTSLFVRGWIRKNSEFFPIILIHELGQNCEQYEEIAHYLNKSGLDVYAFDLRGHGQSGNRLGHIESFETLAKDLLQVVAWIRHIHSGKKPIIVSQGIGALIALFFSRGYSKLITSLVLVSPTLNLIKPIKPYQRFLIRSLAEIAPSMTLPQFCSPQLTESTVKKSIKITNYTANEIIKAISQSRKLLNRLCVPTLIIYSLESPITKFENLKKFVGKPHKSQLISLELVELKNHDLLAKPVQEIEDLLAKIVEWIKSFKDCEDTQNSTE